MHELLLLLQKLLQLFFIQLVQVLFIKDRDLVFFMGKSSFRLLAATAFRLRQCGSVSFRLLTQLGGLSLFNKLAVSGLANCRGLWPFLNCFFHFDDVALWLLLLQQNLLEHLRVHVLSAGRQCVLNHIVVKAFALRLFIGLGLLQGLCLFDFFLLGCFLHLWVYLVLFGVLLHTLLLLQNPDLISEQIKVLLLDNLTQMFLRKWELLRMLVILFLQVLQQHLLLPVIQLIQVDHHLSILVLLLVNLNFLLFFLTILPL